MTPDYVIIYMLAGFTLLAVLGIAGWQMYRTKRAKKTNEHSAMTEGRDPGRR